MDGAAAVTGRRLRRSPRAPGGAARLAQTPGHALAPERVEARVEPADLGEDLVGDLLLLLVGRLGHGLPAHGLPVLHRHLRELEALPVADLRGAVDRRRDDGRPRLEREPADAPLGLLGELARARAPALAVHDDEPAALEDRVGGDKRIRVPVAAADGE